MATQMKENNDPKITLRDGGVTMYNGETINTDSESTSNDLDITKPEEKKEQNAIKNAISRIADFFYEEEPAKKHLEEDENGNMVEIEDEPKKSINWFKVGACSTSITLMLIGAIIMIIKKHH